MNDFYQIKSEITRQITEIESLIRGMNSIKSNEKEASVKRIDSMINELRSVIDESKSEMLMWETPQSNEASKFFDNSKIDIQRLESQFVEMKKRSVLMGNTLERSIQTSALGENKALLEEGNKLLSELGNSVGSAKETGNEILANLSDQKSKLLNIDSELTKLDTNVETGEQIIDLMLCRDRKRTLCLWIMITVLALCTLLFLYFLFVK